MKITTTRLKQISYEDTYAYCILNFERLQARTKGKRQAFATTAAVR